MFVGTGICSRRCANFYSYLSIRFMGQKSKKLVATKAKPDEDKQKTADRDKLPAKQISGPVAEYCRDCELPEGMDWS